MKHIAAADGAFALRWNDADHIAADPEGFRDDANEVLKVLFHRMQREDRDFYQMVETV